MCVCLCRVRSGGSLAADPPFAWERRKGEPSDPPRDPPQRPTLVLIAIWRVLGNTLDSQLDNIDKSYTYFVFPKQPLHAAAALQQRWNARGVVPQYASGASRHGARTHERGRCFFSRCCRTWEHSLTIQKGIICVPTANIWQFAICCWYQNNQNKCF